MLSSTGSPDSLAARLLTSTSASTASSEAKRHGSPTRSYSAFAFLNFFFHRVTRSGPKLLLYLALLLASLLLLTRCLPTDLSDTIVSSTSHLWEFRPGRTGANDGSNTALYPGENNAHDELAGGGLRIVVFGENDIATSVSVSPDVAGLPNANNNTSWTRELCIEVCVTPPPPKKKILCQDGQELPRIAERGEGIEGNKHNKHIHVPLLTHCSLVAQHISRTSPSSIRRVAH